MGVIIRNGRAYTPSQISTVDELPSVGAKNLIYLLGNDLYFWNDELSTPAFVKATLHLDNITIKEKNGLVTGVGADVTGKTYTISGTDYTAAIGATVFNDYVANITLGTYANTFGSGNTSRGSYSTIFGHSNTEMGSYNTIFGDGNIINGTTNFSIVTGLLNTIIGTLNTHGSNIVLGQGNKLIQSSYSVVIGKYNGDNNSQLVNLSESFVLGEYNKNSGNLLNTFICGESNSLTGGAYKSFVIFGDGNTFTKEASDSTSVNSIIGSSNNFSGSIFNNTHVFGSQNTLTDADLSHAIIIGRSHTITNAFYALIGGRSNMASGTLNASIVYGWNNTISSSSFDQCFLHGYSNNITNAASASFIFGENNSVAEDNGANVCMFGKGLIRPSGGTVSSVFIIGRANDDTVTDSIFTIGNGEYTNSVVSRSDALRLSLNGLLQLCGTDGNAVTVNGETIESNRQMLTSIVADASSYTTAYLPQNGQELLLSDTYTVSSITITDITKMFYDNGRGVSNKSVSSVYNSVIMFKKDSSVSSVEDLITNFTAVDNTKIYLLNPDIDISNFTIIHIMLFNDGFNICAIVAGYDDSPANT